MPKQKDPVTSNRRTDALGKVIGELYVSGGDPEVLWEKLLKLAVSGESEVLTGVTDRAIDWIGGTGAKKLTYGSFLSRWKLEVRRQDGI